MSFGVPILRGSLRGRWWSPFSGGKFGRVVGGTYEPDQTALFERLVGPGSVVFDLGAHIGYYTLLAATLVGAKGRVLAFEPNPRNLKFLRVHARMNRLSNTEVLAMAAGQSPGVAKFVRGSGSGTGRLDPAGSLEVDVTSVDLAASGKGLVPDFLKIDVEGAEVLLLSGAKETLASARPVIFLSTHGADLRRQSKDLLTSFGYRFERIGEDRTHSELLCVPAT
ncbi:FkbM family methyltransferase [soil metagenome]